MRQTVKSLTAALLCLCICLSLAVPAFAANETNSEGITFSATLDKTQLTVSESAQTVTMSVVASKGMSLNGIGGTVAWDSALQLQSIGNADDRITSTAGDVNLSNGKFSFITSDTENIENVTSVAEVTFTVPANTAAGKYTVGLNGIELSRRTNGATNAFENGASVSASFTITESGEGTDPVEPALGYSASLKTLSLTPTHEDDFTVDVQVSHKAAEGEEEQTVFAASEMTVTYDPAVLTFVKEDSTLPSADCITEPTAGTLKLADYGADKRFENVHYTLAFTSKQAGQTNVTLTAAAFTNKENAATRDLTGATLVNNVLNMDIQKKVFNVNLPSEFTGSDTVIDGADYIMTLVDNDHNITSVRAYYADGSEAQVVDNDDGTYTIKAVSGSIARIDVVKEAKIYEVSFDGADPKGEKVTSATYGVDYVFTLPDDTDAFTADGVRYTLEKIMMGTEVFTDYSYDSTTRTYTIEGSMIKGDMVITIRGEVLPLTHYAVTVDGDLSEIGTDYATSVEKNAPYTLSFTQIKGFHYTVKATMGGGEEFEVTGVLNEETNQHDYTINSVTGNLVFHVTRYEDMGKVTAEKYLTIDSEEVDLYIILKQTELEDNWKPVYEVDGVRKDMFWSDKYNAYCYLVFDKAPNLEEYKTHIKLEEGHAPELSYSMDVNKSTNVDAADAQLVYNMYNSLYTDFTDTVTMEKFLLADVVGEEGKTPVVDVNDAVAIIASILAPNSAQ